MNYSRLDTNICPFEEDLGKNLYRKKTYYTICIEQEVLANNKEEADKLLSDCGIAYDQINSDITEQKNNVETYMVDANYSESGDTEYKGKVVYEEDSDPADGFVEIDPYADEVEIPDDVDTQLNLQFENTIGK